ncbi:MAG: hypothetical protein GXP10_10930 [Gammaproteobacteria bacterium]|nr:hypothetical protein [Gammaproteobacteria bacterium]
MMTRPTEQQAGFVLIASLTILLVLTLLTLSALGTTTLQEKMASNLQLKTQALFAAEAGAQKLLAWYASNAPAFAVKATPDVLAFTAPSHANFGTAAYWLGAINYDSASPPTYVDAQIYATTPGHGGSTQLAIRIEPYRTLDAAFSYALLANGDINVDPRTAIIGNVYANGDISGIDETENETETVAIPGIDSTLIDRLRATSQNGAGHQYYDGSCSLSSENTPTITLVFCEGDVTITASAQGERFSAITIVTPGAVTVTDAFADNSAAIRSAVIASGTITVNSEAEQAAVFWSAEDILLSGTGGIRGALIAAGNINVNDPRTIAGNATIDNNNLPRTHLRFRMSAWKQL